MRQAFLTQFIFRVLFLCALITAIATIFLMPVESIKNSDYISFITGPAMLQGGEKENFYDLETQYKYQSEIKSNSGQTKTLLPYINPAYMAVIFYPFSKLSLVVGYRLFGLINLGAFVFLFLKLRNYFSFDFNSPKAFIFAFFLPLYSAILLPQTSAFLALILFLLYEAVKKSNFKKTLILSGVLFIKPQYLLIVPFILPEIKNKKNYLLGLLGISLVFFLTNVYLTGWRGPLAYLGMLSQTDNPAFGNRPWQMFTMAAFLENILGFIKTYSLLISTLGYLLSTIAMLKSKLDYKTKYMFGILISVYFSPHALVHDLSVLIIPIYLLLESTKKLFLVRCILAGLLFLLPLASALSITHIVSFGVFLIFVILFFYDRSIFSSD